jgi:hypothetical protein
MLCCCTHAEELHLGGPDLSQAELEALHLARSGGDGGMCRARVGNGRCTCFNFCDCYLIVAAMEAEGEQ